MFSVKSSDSNEHAPDLNTKPPTATKENVLPKLLMGDEEEAASTAVNDYGPHKRKKGVSTSNETLPVVSKNYIIGKKGYPEEIEHTNDGKIEMKEIVGHLRKNKQEKIFFKKITYAATAVGALVVLCNFGLVWATLVLTHHMGIQNGSLVDSSTGEEIHTRIGTRIVAKANGEYIRRLLQLHGRRQLSRASGLGDSSFRKEVRRLNEDVHAATFDKNHDQMRQLFLEYQEGSPATVSITLGDTEHTGVVGPGVTLTHDKNDCDVYGNMKEEGNRDVVYGVTCCETGDCIAQVTEGNIMSRRLFTRDAEGWAS